MTDSDGTKRLFLLDGMALIYRAHFALIRSPRFTSRGTCTSAVFGLANTVLDILNREKPTHVAVVFDTDDPTHRHQEYPEYKGQRQAIPEDLFAQFPLVQRLFEGFRIATIRIPGYEADDIIATLACQAEQDGFTTWMVTPDKDLQQLVNERILVYKPGRQGSSPERLGVPEVLEKWKIQRVEQVVDILGLMGDSSDNIPGVPGIGEKTAQKLIAEFGSVENLLSNTGRLKGKQKQLLESHVEQALLSKRLVTIVRDVPHDIQLAALKLDKYDDQALTTLFVELEFETLGKRLFGPSFVVNPRQAASVGQQGETEIQITPASEAVKEKTIRDVTHDYQILGTPAERSQLIATLLDQPVVGIAIMPAGRNPREAVPLGIAFALAPQSGSYVLFPDDPAEALAVLEEFRPVFESEKIEKVGHHLKQQATLLRWHGIELRGKLLDTLLAHYMKEPEMRHGLDYLSKLYPGASRKGSRRERSAAFSFGNCRRAARGAP